MNITPDLSKKEIARRKKVSAMRKKAIAKKRQDGLKRYWKQKREEKKLREKEEKKEKARLKKEKEKERLKAYKEKHRKKTGRKKKPGPKVSKYERKKRRLAKLNKKPVDRKLPPFKYQIILCRNREKKKLIGKYRSIEDAYSVFKDLKYESEAVVFPRMTRIKHDVTNSLDECIMIAKTDDGPTMLRNEYGKLVEQQTNLEGWEIIDKFKYNVEETFWVWGYDNRGDRKDFQWIYNEISEGFESNYEFRRVFVFHNKLLARFDDGHLMMVICKTEMDCTKLYNEIQSRANKEKVKQIVFLGDKSEPSEYRRKLEDEIIEMTGWTRKKVCMRDTTYYSK